MANGNGSAPVCPVSRSQTPPAMPGVQYPAVPRAFDLPSVIAALNQIVMMLPALTGHPVLASGSTQPLPSPSGGQWVEIGRNIQIARVHDPDDENVFVDIPRLAQIRYRHNISGNTFVWTL